MTQVRNTLGLLVQRFAAKTRVETKTQRPQRPVEVDAKTLRHVGGGLGEAQTPRNGW